MNFTQPRGANIYTTAGNITSSSLRENSKGYSFKLSHITGISSRNSAASVLINSYFFSLKTSVFNGSLLYSDPTYSHTAEKVAIHIFYYNNDRIFKDKTVHETLSHVKMSSLSSSLASVYKKEVSLVLTRIHYPYLNSSIFSKYLVHNAPSNTFVHFQDSILTYPSRNASELPAYISGIKIELAGRLLTEPVVPRITRKATLFGSFSGPVDYAKCTTKNELGAFTIKV
jgi:hypothetical protein